MISTETQVTPPLPPITVVVARAWRRNLRTTNDGIHVCDSMQLSAAKPVFEKVSRDYRRSRLDAVLVQLTEARRKVRELQTSEADKEVAIHRLEAKLALANIEARQNARREQERIEVRTAGLLYGVRPARIPLRTRLAGRRGSSRCLVCALQNKQLLP